MFGTLCAIDPEPHELHEDQVALLVVLARLVATQIERDRELVARHVVEEQLRRHAWYDVLTGLPNRALLLERLQQTLAASQHHNEPPYAVLFMDLDRFKAINDSLGHLVGDAVLRETANRLQNCVRRIDTIARLGGDEFVILLPDISDIRSAARIADQVQQAISVPFQLGDHTVVTTASIGLVWSNRHYSVPEEVLRDADIAMYRAKAQGKARYAIFDQAMHVQMLARLWLESALRRAIDHNELVLHYQPVVDVRTGQVTELEALVRWQHPERGLISPAEFIPVAEETGLIVQLGTWVVQAACAQIQQWRREGVPRLPVAVNLSLRQVADTNLVATIIGILHKMRVSPQDLILEITESTLMETVGTAEASLHALHKAGVKLALDDFGTGYSSLAYLSRLPLTCVKIDRSFVHDLPGNERQLAITTAMIAMGQRLGLTVVAEGVETDAQLAVLRDHQCDAVQGHLLSPALPAAQIADFLCQCAHPQTRKHIAYYNSPSSLSC